jgi:zinc transporter 9
MRELTKGEEWSSSRVRYLRDTSKADLRLHSQCCLHSSLAVRKTAVLTRQAAQVRHHRNHAGRLFYAVAALHSNGYSVCTLEPWKDCDTCKRNKCTDSIHRSILAGLLPLSFALSQKQLRFITALGTGVLVGTSLIVIIPEGIETVYSASGSSHGHNKRDIAFGMSRRDVDYTSSVAEVAWTSMSERDDAIHALVPRAQGDFMTGPDDGFRTEEEIAADLSKPGHPSTDPGHEEVSSLPPSEQKVKPSSQGHHEEDQTGHNPHAYVGISLIAGFILMYLIDTLPRRASSSSQPQRFQINLTQFSLNRPSTSSPNAGSPPHESEYDPTSQASSSSSRPSSTTVGLVIHACADGIALGASSTSSGASSSGRNLSFIIFIALMIHKAPAAFGLTTTLLKQGLSKRAARAHLIVFSLAAPAGALVTWAAASLLGYGGLPESMSAEFATGVLLLFSGGTFLYVAMHTMQDVGGHAEHASNGYAEVPMNSYGESGGAQNKATNEHGVAETFFTVAGMMLPLLTQFGHAH